MQYYDRLECNEQTLWGAYIPQRIFYMNSVRHPADYPLYYINRAGIVTKTPENFVIARHDIYPFTQIACVVSGQGELQIQGKTYDLLPGSLFFLPSYQSHQYRSLPEDPMGLVWIEFSGGDSDRLSHLIFEKNGAVFTGNIYKTMYDLCVSFLNHVESTSQSSASMMVYSALLALYSFGDCETEKEKIMRDVSSYISNHLHEPILMADTAKKFGYTSTYFSYWFSKNFGKSFTDYLLECRMVKARYLLMSTSLTLDEIASCLGFCDSSHFIQRFRKAEHISPAQYRKVNQYI